MHNGYQFKSDTHHFRFRLDLTHNESNKHHQFSQRHVLDSLAGDDDEWDQNSHRDGLASDTNAGGAACRVSQLALCRAGRYVPEDRQPGRGVPEHGKLALLEPVDRAGLLGTLRGLVGLYRASTPGVDDAGVAPWRRQRHRGDTNGNDAHDDADNQCP